MNICGAHFWKLGVVGQNYRVGTLWCEARSQPGLYKKTWKANRQTHSSARHSGTCLSSQNSGRVRRGYHTVSSKPARQNNKTLSQANKQTTKAPQQQQKETPQLSGSEWRKGVGLVPGSLGEGGVFSEHLFCFLIISSPSLPCRDIIILIPKINVVKKCKENVHGLNTQQKKAAHVCSDTTLWGIWKPFQNTTVFPGLVPPCDSPVPWLPLLRTLWDGSKE